ncbi:adenylate/guanylate cyclase domain-containing protein [Mycolicibacterium smegmatis]|uniref:adenylate/guanylate cyclase domain-containing protein n=1 Tax=Mycolicibacterium smegmatis TaxID=1772 RepID=UPI0020A295C1|nr:adenylate/guanylate cyclase domain-containing protein [Mycolicibacterium smegmatis]MCP2624792.1 adenylate/guanylate cyclase domain-containing protein [Mycolicibacterium smegmatis]
MERIWQWAWDHRGPRYAWVLYAIGLVIAFPVYLALSIVIAVFEGSGRHAEAVGATVVAVLVLMYGLVLPGTRGWRLIDRWGEGDSIDPAEVLEETYIWSRRAAARAIPVVAVVACALAVTVGVVAGASTSRLVQYGFLGVVFGPACHLIGVHSLVEAPLRPLRVALGGRRGLGDALPRSRPTFATWTNLSMLGIACAFAIAGAMLASVLDDARRMPALWAAIGIALTLGFGVPITVFASFSPALRPIRDLAEATRRVSSGNYSQRLPVVQDDDLGVLAASFNRMQAGLAERQRLQAAFGTYVDPILAARLLAQGDDVFAGERRMVTVMFVDIRDFTPFAESNTAEDTVSRLNALFGIVVPTVVDAGGHVNKFLGDGALAVFGAPDDLEHHADATLSAAVEIHRQVIERFDGELRIGIGINTGTVIAGTIGGGSKLEFTLIGDTVNVAARVEQLTKKTGDTILLTQQCVEALDAHPPVLVDRGPHALKGKSEPTALFTIDAVTSGLA